MSHRELGFQSPTVVKESDDYGLTYGDGGSPRLSALKADTSLDRIDYGDGHNFWILETARLHDNGGCIVLVDDPC